MDDSSLPPRPAVFRSGPTAASQQEFALRQAEARYQQEQVLSASPERLLTMLYDRLIVDVERAESAQLMADWQQAATHLRHAQDIVTELNGSLTAAWDGAGQLRSIYVHVQSMLVRANTQKDVSATRHCREVIVPLRDAWYEAAAVTSRIAEKVAADA